MALNPAGVPSRAGLQAAIDDAVAAALASVNNTLTTRSKGGAVVTGTFPGIGAANTLTFPVTFAVPFDITPNVNVFAHGDPTTFVLWASDVVPTGFTLNVYRTSGTNTFTARWIAHKNAQ